MGVVKLASFAEFLDHYSSAFPRPQPDETGHIPYHSDLLFRGHGDDGWELKTTLERYGKPQCPISDYIEYIDRCIPEYGSYTGRQSMDTIDSRKFILWQKVLEDKALLNLIIELRHYGFPSPLLDWTRSPYIAAYFAYNEAGHDGSIAIYTFREITGQGKIAWSEQPIIKGIGQYLETIDRHHIQQAQYTVCTQKKGDVDYFSSHEDGFNESDEGQDLLVKYVLPASEKNKVLNDLQRMNINSYTLFRNQESLCQYLAHKYIR